MERKGIFFKLKPGKAAEYERAHAGLPPEMAEVLHRAGFRNYSIWRTGDLLFAYYELADDVPTEQVLNESAVYARWREKMEEYVFIEPQTGQKEWPMKLVFLQEK